jgi:hypothetical protein
MARPDVYDRLDRIKELWRELERTRPTAPRYQALIGEIHAESLAYQALLAEQDELDRRQARTDLGPIQEDVDRRRVQRRQINRRKK